MTYNFDEIIDRTGSDSIKWQFYGPDVLPMWVADMDFRSPEPVIKALQTRVAEGIFGYTLGLPELNEVLVERLRRLYNWEITPEMLLFVPGIVAGFNLVMKSLCAQGEGVLVQTPVYPPMLTGPANNGLVLEQMELTRGADGCYSVDADGFEAAISERTRMFLLCNPHNPTGRAFRPDELEQMAETCLRRNLVICSDEIHCDLLAPGVRHFPIASLGPEIAQNTVTLMAPSKTFNIPGLACSVVIVSNAELRKQITRHLHETVGGVNVLGFAGGLAAYRDGQPWLDDLLAYLAGNRAYLAAYIEAHMPGLQMTPLEATYLAWIDCRQAGIPGDPARFFLKQARVALNDGALFGRGGDGFVRLNFGCPRATLSEGLERMAAALRSGGAGE